MFHFYNALLNLGSFKKYVRLKLPVFHPPNPPSMFIPVCFTCNPAPSRQKHLATARQLIRKNSACYLKIRHFFSQSEHTDRLHHVLKAVSVVSLQIVLYQSILLHFPTTHYNHIHHIWTLFFFFCHLITHSIYDSKFLENHYIILKRYHRHLFFSHLYFFFTDLDYLDDLNHQQICSEKSALI